jgi:hypothetical protein
MRRLARSSFLQRYVLPLFGYYPWECFACRKTRLLRVRGKRSLRRIWDDDLSIPPEEAELPTHEIDLHADERELEQDAPVPTAQTDFRRFE